jgi:hypothetical protein
MIESIDIVEEHKNHNSVLDPKPDCELCRKEIFRRTHKCYGDGFSTKPLKGD